MVKPIEWVNKKFGVTLDKARAAMVMNRAQNPDLLEPGQNIKNYVQQMVDEMGKSDEVMRQAQSIASGKPYTASSRKVPMTTIQQPKVIVPQFEITSYISLPPKKHTVGSVVNQLRWLGVKSLADIEDKFPLLEKIYRKADLDMILQIAVEAMMTNDTLDELNQGITQFEQEKVEFEKQLDPSVRTKGMTKKEQNWQNFYDEVYEAMQAGYQEDIGYTKQYGEVYADSDPRQWSSYMYYYWGKLGFELFGRKVKRNQVPDANYFLNIFEKLHEDYGDSDRLARFISKVATGKPRARKIKWRVCLGDKCEWKTRKDVLDCPKCGKPIEVKIEIVDTKPKPVRIEPAIGIDTALIQYLKAIDQQLDDLIRNKEEVLERWGLEPEFWEQIDLPLVVQYVANELNRPMQIRKGGYLAFALYLITHNKISTADLTFPSKKSPQQIGQEYLNRKPGGYIFRLGEPKTAVYRESGIYIEITNRMSLGIITLRK